MMILDLAFLSYDWLNIFIPTSFDKFFETGKFEEKSHIVHSILQVPLTL